MRMQQCIYTSFLYRSQPSTRNNENWLKTVKNSRNLLFACEDNLNNLWLSLLCFQKFALSVKTIRLHDNDIVAYVFISFHFGDRFQKLSFSVKTIIVFDRFRADARWNRKEKFAVYIYSITLPSTWGSVELAWSTDFLCGSDSGA